MGGRPITNKLKNPKWENKIKRFKLDPTLKWEFAEILQINDDGINFITFKKKKET